MAVDYAGVWLVNVGLTVMFLVGIGKSVVTKPSEKDKRAPLRLREYKNENQY